MNPIEKISKFILCVLFTQLGKTFTAIKRILSAIDEDEEFGRSIHIVFTMNTIGNNDQFAKRLEEVAKKYKDEANAVTIVSSQKYTGKYKHVKSEIELRGLCMVKKDCPRVVVMCSNKTRFADGVEFIKTINENRLHIHRVFVFYDELHKYISVGPIRNQIEEIHELDIVKCIMALTATPEKIFKKTPGFWSNLRLVHFNDFNETNYAGHKDMIFNCVDDFFASPYIRPSPFDYDVLDQQNIEFIRHVLRKYPEILADNTRTFIPGQIRCVSHFAVRDLIFERKPNAVVTVINGVEKTLQFKEDGNTKTIPLVSENTEEVCETIARLVLKHGLSGRPLVITGLLCVGMGQTLTHKSLGSFTSAIFGHLDLTNDDIYQLFGRITGRMKDWDTYIQTQVYCPTTIMHRCSVMERCSRNMAAEHNGELVSHADYTTPMHEMGEEGQAAIDNIRPVKEKKEKSKVQPNITSTTPRLEIDTYRIYDNEEIVKKVCKFLDYGYQTTRLNDNGFKETSLNAKKAVVSLSSAIEKVRGGYGGGKSSKMAFRTYYPCYVDTTDNTTLRFVVIIRPTTDINKLKTDVDTIYPPLVL